MINKNSFKAIVGTFCAGVTIVTIKSVNDYHGLTVSSFCSVSLEPPLVLFCRKNTGAVNDNISPRDNVVINILSNIQKDLAFKFANPTLNHQDRFKGIDFSLSANDIPLLMGCKSHLECEIIDQISAGDHIVYIGQVEDGEVFEERNPMIYFGNKFHQLQPVQIEDVG